MTTKILILCILLLELVTSCAQPQTNNLVAPGNGKTLATRISPPMGYSRVITNKNSFAYYLQNFDLKPDGSKVLYYNGQQKPDQNLHIAVLDIDVGARDLQQCADAVMRLYGEYLYVEARYDEIAFNFISDSKPRYFINYKENDTSYRIFRKYMDYIFSYANTRSLYHQMAEVNFDDMRIGDVLIQVGNPYGHAVIVIDMAINKQTNEKAYLLAQSYMPAQSIHVLKNPSDTKLSPWYKISSNTTIRTPEWIFYQKDLRRFNPG